MSTALDGSQECGDSQPSRQPAANSAFVPTVATTGSIRPADSVAVLHWPAASAARPLGAATVAAAGTLVAMMAAMANAILSSLAAVFTTGSTRRLSARTLWRRRGRQERGQKRGVPFLVPRSAP